MSYFQDIYLKRLNRYGLDYQARLQNKREDNFENLLLKSVYRIDFSYENKEHPGLLERYKQDETQTLQYLLTRVSLNMPSGTILMLPNKDDILKPYMVYWLEEIRASGYNRYIVLKMTHYIHWYDRDHIARESWAYLYGQEDNMLKDEIRSRSRMDTLYSENLKLSFLVMPLNPYIKRDDYFEIGEDDFREAYRVTGYDIQSTPGVEYVSIDPVYLRDDSNLPDSMICAEDDADDKYYWLEGGDLK